ncbi:MAG: AAA family ATPase [Alphaproteobacteria bacterium]|nr:AAA family ATPase [Alphaproteobacteria bacterium]
MANTINRIGKLKEIGSFKDFIAPKDLACKEVNLFYGYNGSGKTTLTRIFSGLGDGVVFPDFSSGEIDVTCNDTSIKDFAKTNVGGKVKVFNEDFVENNLELKSHKAKKLSAVIGADNIAVKKEIDDLEAKKSEMKDKSGKLKAEAEKDAAIGAFDNLTTEIAQTIRASLQITNAPAYTKKHFTSDYTKYKAQAVKPTVSEDDYKKAAGFYVASVKPAIEDKYITALSNLGAILIPQDYTKIFDLLKTPIKRKGALLKEEVIKWVEEGAKLHETEHEACKFCGQGITTETWKARTTQIQELIKKDDEFERLEGEFTTTKTVKDKYLDVMKVFSCDLTEAHFLTTELFSEYKTARAAFDIAYSAFDSSLKKLGDKIDEKETRKDSAIQVDDTDDFNNNVSQLSDAATKVIEAINKNNLAVAESDKLKQESKDKVIAFHIQQNESKLSKVEEEQATKTAMHTQAIAAMQVLDADINTKKATLENQATIITEINKLLETTLDIGLVFKIEPGSGEYQLERKIDGASNKPATNLSEGERNLIAFLYFLVSLKSSTADDKKNEIIVIDDPVSSLDSTNLFVIQNLVVSALAQYGQQFFLTHNFYFFAKVREAMKAQLRKHKKEEKDSLEIFEITKDKKNGSQIKKASRYVRTHISEYMSLMDALKAIWIKEDDEKDVATGNMIRRVLEVFLSFKDTNKNHLLFDKMSALAGDNQKYKSLLNMAHAFSHTLETTSITDDATFSYASGKQEIGELFSFMKEKDSEHFKGFGIELETTAEEKSESSDS